MPIFDFECKMCDTMFEAIIKTDAPNPPCKACGGDTQKKVSAGKHFAFKEGWYEHIGPKPIYIDSEKKLREECKKHDCSSVYLLDR